MAAKFFSHTPRRKLSRREFLATSAALAGSAVLPIGGCAHAPAPKPREKLARSTRGMVTSPHVLASEAGLEVLASGGNAIEAAIAMGAVLWVTYPHFCGIGGDAFCVIADRKGTARTLSGVGQAAANAPNYSDKVPVRGPGSALTSAAAVDTWGQAYEFSRKYWGGKRSWRSLFKRATEYAANGFPVTPSQRFWHEFRAKEVKDWPGFARIFMPQGKIPEIGEMFYQPELARTLERVANNGDREFYEGELAGRIAEGLKKAGSPLTAEDFACAHPRPRRDSGSGRISRWRTVNDSSAHTGNRDARDHGNSRSIRFRQNS